MDIQFQHRYVAAIRFRSEGQITVTRGFDIVTLQIPLRIGRTAVDFGTPKKGRCPSEWVALVTFRRA